MSDSIEKTRKRVTKHLMKRYKNNIKLSTQFLQDMFDAYDKLFCGYYIRDTLKEKNSTLKFEVSKRHTSVAGQCAKEGCRYTIRVSAKTFERISFPSADTFYINNGLKCYSLLECLQMTLEHELIHLLIYLVPLSGDLSVYSERQRREILAPHGELFKCLAHGIFGHTSFHHLLRSTLAGVDLDQLKTSFRVGDRVVVFFLDGVKLEGTVQKLLKHTVRVFIDQSARAVDIGYPFVKHL